MKSDSLHRLIHSLSKKELDYCKQALERSTTDKSNDKMFLFNSLLKMKKYDSKQLKNAVQGRKISRNLAVEKNRLFQRISFHLSEYLEEHKPINNPEKLLKQAEALVHLAMLEEALEVTQKGITWAMRLEELHLEVRLRNLLRLIYKHLDQFGLDHLRIENEYLLETGAKKLARSVRYQLINDRAFDYLRRFRVTNLDSVEKGMEELINLPEMKDINMADSLQSQLHYYYILSFYHSSRNEVNEALDALSWCLKLLESNQERLTLYFAEYLSTISNILGKLSMAKRLDEAPALLKKMEQVVARGKREEARKFAAVELQYQLYYMNSGKLKQVFDREDNVQQGLRRFGKGINISSRLTLLYNLGVSHLIFDHPRKALHYFNQIKELGTQPHRQDIQGVARLIRLLLLVENDTAGTFSHYLRNSQRFFKSGQSAYKLESTILSWLSRHHKLNTAAQKTNSFQQLAQAVWPFMNGGMLGAEEILIWSVAHAKKLPADEVFKNGIHKKIKT